MYVFEIYEFIYPFIYSLASVIAAHCNYDYYSEQDLFMFMLARVMLCYVRRGFVIAICQLVLNDVPGV